MKDIEKIIKGLESLYEAMCQNQCYTCSHEFIDEANEFGTEILLDAIELLQNYKNYLQEELASLKNKVLQAKYEIACDKALTKIYEMIQTEKRE